MKKCFWKPLALVHKLEHSLTATTFYKKKLIPVHSGVIPVHSGPFRSIPVSFRFIPVHSGPFRSIPPHSGSFRSVSVFSNALPILFKKSFVAKRLWTSLNWKIINFDIFVQLKESLYTTFQLMELQQVIWQSVSHLFWVLLGLVCLELTHF